MRVALSCLVMNTAPSPPTPLQRLLYRWFVQFNPLYLLSAAFVLTGCFLLSRGLASQESLWASLGITSVSEVYAFALVGGAAFLVRIDARRPAVMLGLLCLLYQWDLTLHTETSAYLGTGGQWATAGWILVFHVRLYALAWALRLRLSGRVVIAALIGAFLLALGPRVVPGLGERGAGALVASCAFVLGAIHGRGGGLASKVALSAWGETVLRRCARVMWFLSAGLLAAHVLFWSKDHAIALSFVVPVVPLVALRYLRKEADVWRLVTATLVFVAFLLPSAFGFTAVLTAAALVLRALSPLVEPTPAAPAPAPQPGPYRAGGAEAYAGPPPSDVAGAVGLAFTEKMRCFTGAAFALYLAAWTAGWSGGAWPAHVVWLDAAMTAIVVLAAWRFHGRAFVAPLLASYAHLVVQTEAVRAPHSSVEWGATCVAIGFSLLGASLLASYRLRGVALDAVGRR
jgi:hypothetical protein